MNGSHLKELSPRDSSFPLFASLLLFLTSLVYARPGGHDDLYFLSQK
jgi:hypothetical protein